MISARNPGDTSPGRWSLASWEGLGGGAAPSEGLIGEREEVRKRISCDPQQVVEGSQAVLTGFSLFDLVQNKEILGLNSPRITSGLGKFTQVRVK